MRVVCLIEDAAGKDGFVNEHGLSLYIETEKHRLLSDTGASEKTFVNAQKAGVDIKSVDTVILSHGHYDHTGGMMKLGGLNKNCRFYMHRNAVFDYYNLRDGEKYIGIDKRICNFENLVLTDDFLQIDDELSVFSAVKGRKLFSASNSVLKKKLNGAFVQDDFDHEQYCVINSGSKTLLVSGCAHNGIVNILDKYYELYGAYPDAVISGFHFMKNSAYTEEETEIIKETANALNRLPCVFYTGHCTGMPAFDIMKKTMGSKLGLIFPGLEIEV